MFKTYNYFRQYNDNQYIDNYKEFYRKFSNEREFGGEFSKWDHLIRGRFFNTIHHMYNIILRKRPSHILDIGCGNGINLPLASIFPFLKYHAIDYAEKTIDVAKKEYPNIDFRVGDAFNLPYHDSEFDMAISSSVIILYEHEEDRINLLNEAKRVIKDDGILVLILWNETFLIKYSLMLSRIIGKLKKENLPRDFMGCHFSHGDVKNMANKAGFNVIEYIDTSSLWGAGECVQYLNMKKYNRNFGKAESEQDISITQNIKNDLLNRCGNPRLLATVYYYISQLCPSLLSWFTIYILCKRQDASNY
ncbi:MAG: SAM-dependent methyltransferase, type 11 [Clostridia bacterium]|nr:SAM-dependent methyltransferase, type 11 [Clostridia bacterium]